MLPSTDEVTTTLSTAAATAKIFAIAAACYPKKTYLCSRKIFVDRFD